MTALTPDQLAARAKRRGHIVEWIAGLLMLGVIFAFVVYLVSAASTVDQWHERFERLDELARG